MKISIILLLILLAGSACASGQPVAPITHPIPIVIPGDGTVASGTAIPVCACPTGMVTPPQSQGGATNPSAVICNCPAILVPPPVPTSGIGSNPQTVPANGITLADNRKTFVLHPGESFLLNLGMDGFDWTINIDNQNVISRERNITVIRGAQGVYQAANPGQAVLSAVGDPLCRQSTPACMTPSILFKVTVIVQ